MSEGVQLAQAAGSADPGVGLKAVRQLRELAERLERLQVGRARELGWTWQQVADELGVSRQAVHKKYADASEGPSGAGSRLLGRGLRRKDS